MESINRKWNARVWWKKFPKVETYQDLSEVCNKTMALGDNGTWQFSFCLQLVAFSLYSFEYCQLI